MIEFNADQDPAFYLNAVTDPDPGSQNQCGSMQIQILVRLSKGRKSGCLLLLADFYCSWIRIRIPDTDPDQGQSTMQGPLSKTNCFFL
jgi:hypothetical protein